MRSPTFFLKTGTLHPDIKNFIGSLFINQKSLKTAQNLTVAIIMSIDGSINKIIAPYTKQQEYNKTFQDVHLV